MVILVVATAAVTFFDNKLGATPREGNSHIKRTEHRESFCGNMTLQMFCCFSIAK